MYLKFQLKDMHYLEEFKFMKIVRIVINIGPPAIGVHIVK